MDADVGMGELELIYMKGSKAHSGFPEVRPSPITVYTTRCTYTEQTLYDVAQ